MKLRDFVFWGLFVVVSILAAGSFGSSIWANLHPVSTAYLVEMPVKIIELCAGQPV